MERTTRAFKVAIKNLDDLTPLREMFGDEKFQEIIAGMGEKVAQLIREQRNPDNGEFPLATSCPIGGNYLRIEVDATDRTHEFLARRMAELGMHLTEVEAETAAGVTEKPLPKAFLSYAHHDKPLAKRIATALLARGIDTFLDEWELRSGDSIRQKLEGGIAACTHFVALLTPASLTRPWAKLEVDAGLAGRLAGRHRFIGLTHEITADDLTPFLKALLMRPISTEHFDRDMGVVIDDILEISRKPPLGETSGYTRAHLPDLSVAATAVAKYFVEHSKLARDWDPATSAQALSTELGLALDDVVDAFQELKGLGCMRVREGFGPASDHGAGPTERLFVRYDKHWMGWDAAKDAVAIARHAMQGESSTEKIASALDWTPRRMNPALQYLIERELVMSSESYSDPFTTHWIQPTDETRRFLKNLS